MPAASRPSLLDSARIGWKLSSDPAAGLTVLHERYGNVVDIGFGSQRYVVLFGPEANRFVLHDEAENFLWGPVLRSLAPVNGETALVVTDGPEHERRRKIVQPAFHVRRINGYLATMLEEIDRSIDALAVGETVDLYGAFRRCIRRIVLRCLLGDDLLEHADPLGDELEAAIDYVQRAPIRRLDRPVFPPYRRAMAARASADRRIHAEIERRRRAPGSGDDVLSWLLEATDEDGTPLSDVEIRDQVVSLVAAGYDTTSAAVAWTLRAVLDHDVVRAAVTEEVGDGSVLDDAVQLGGLPTVDGAVRESLRLWPPGVVSGRQAVRDLEFQGFTIPAGRKVLYSQYVTQRMPELFPEPERFRPDRWRSDQPGVHDRYAFLPFGGGYRRCIGHAFATLEAQATLARFVQRVDARPVGPFPPGRGLASWAPVGGVPVHVRGVR